MKFTDKFALLTTSVVLACIGLVLLGGLFTLRSLSFKYHQQRIDSIISVIERQLDKNIQKNEFDVWLPDLLDASGVVRLQIKQKSKLVYKNYYDNRHFYPESRLLHYQYQLKNYPDITLVFNTRHPFDDIKMSMAPLLGVSLAVLLSLLLLAFALYWIKKQFKGAELLALRAKYLLQNNPTARIAQHGEWPVSASKALDVLSEQLEQSKRERSYFDAHIRGKVFLDEVTGLENSLALENRLDALVREKNILASALLLIRFPELESIGICAGLHIQTKMLQQISELLSTFSARYDECFLGRISKSEFVLIIPQMSYQETEVVAKQLSRLLFQLQLPDAFTIDEFFYIGVVNVHYGEQFLLIMEDLNRALLVAQHQKVSGWFLAEQEDKHIFLSKGTVRWRTLLELRLQENAILFYSQKIICRDAVSELYVQLCPRIKDLKENEIATDTLLDMAEKCGLDTVFYYNVLGRIITLLVKRGQQSKALAINLRAHFLMEKISLQWFIYELMQLPRGLRNNLIIEVSENQLDKHYLALRTALNALQKVGCKISIDNVGKSVVNTGYIIDYNIDYLKLDASLVGDIHLRKANQLALQSLMASCLNSRAKIIAEGIENKEEWKCLYKLGIYAGQGKFMSSQTLLI